MQHECRPLYYLTHTREFVFLFYPKHFNSFPSILNPSLGLGPVLLSLLECPYQGELARSCHGRSPFPCLVTRHSCFTLGFSCSLINYLEQVQLISITALGPPGKLLISLPGKPQPATYSYWVIKQPSYVNNINTIKFQLKKDRIQFHTRKTRHKHIHMDRAQGKNINNMKNQNNMSPPNPTISIQVFHNKNYNMELQNTGFNK